MIDNEIIELKVILLGESGTGKTNLLNVCCNLKFNSNNIPNISASYLEKKVVISNITYGLKFWDTAGQEKYRSLNNIFIKDSNICIFVYDVTRPDTFKELNYWVEAAKEILGKKATFAIVANKIDLEQKVKKEEGENLAENIEGFFFEASAKNDKGEFSEFVDKLVNEYLKKNCLEGWEIISLEGRISLSTNAHKKKNHHQCC